MYNCFRTNDGLYMVKKSVSEDKNTYQRAGEEVEFTQGAAS